MSGRAPAFDAIASTSVSVMLGAASAMHRIEKPSWRRAKTISWSMHSSGRNAMNRTATIRARVEPELKVDVEKLLHQPGLSTTEAINLFYSQVRLRQGLSFPVEIPNAETRETFEATDRGEDLNSYESLDEMFEALDRC